MSQSTTRAGPASKGSGNEPRVIGWTPIVIAGGLILAVALAFSLSRQGSSPPTTTTSTTTPVVSPAGTQMWTGDVTLTGGQEYGLDHPSATIDDTCTNCIIIEGVLGYGEAFSDSGGFQLWKQHGAPTYNDCVGALRVSLPALALWDPPTNALSKDTRPGKYLCALANDGNVLSMRYDGATHNGNAFKWSVISWSPG
jgi:hypothetical protein